MRGERGVRMDWQAVKIEYITDPEASYRSLSEKHGIPRSTLEKRARREGWPAERKASVGRTVRKAVKAHENRQKKRIERVVGNVDRLLDRVEQAVEELDRQVLREVVKTKKITYDGTDSKRVSKETVKEKEKLVTAETIIDRAGLKAVASALKDIKEILSPKDELDISEQRARIANLEKQARRDELPEDKCYGVVFLPAVLPAEQPPEE